MGILITGQASASREEELIEALRLCAVDKIEFQQALVNTMDKKELENVFLTTRNTFLCGIVLIKTDFNKGIKLVTDTKKILIDHYGEHMGGSITAIFSTKLGMWYQEQSSNTQSEILNDCNEL